MSLWFGIFRPFQNDILLDSMVSLKHESKFWGTSRSTGVLQSLVLGVKPRGKLEKNPNLSFQV